MPFAEAQTDFRLGYVLPLAGDTLRGEVDSREGRANAQHFRFQPAPEPSTLAPSPQYFCGLLSVDLTK